MTRARACLVGAVLLHVLAGAACDDGDPDPAVPADVTGRWSGAWTSTKGVAGGAFSISVTQIGGAARGSGAIERLGPATVDGSISGNRWSGTVTGGGLGLSFVVTAGSARADGTYTTDTGDAGTLTLLRSGVDGRCPAEAASQPADRLEGTVWLVTDAAPSTDGMLRFEFMTGGVLGWTVLAKGEREADAAWSQLGNCVRMSFDSDFAVSLGTIRGGAMSGTASTVEGLQWTWTALRER
jgi:hypothetical protein